MINDIDRRFEKSPVFQLRRCWSGNAVFPFSLSIVDCYFIYQALAMTLDRQGRIDIERLSNFDDDRERLGIHDAFDLYVAIRYAEGREVAFMEHETGVSIYLDEHERFVLVEGPEKFLENARPYPDEIERHMYIEYMHHLKRDDYPVSPERMYLALKRSKADQTAKSESVI